MAQARALGAAAMEQHEMADAITHLRRAVRVAEEHGLEFEAASARLRLASPLTFRGDFTAALSEIDRAALVLRGHDLALAHFQRASALMVQGRLDEACEGFRRALPELRQAGDELNAARLLNNRGLLHSNRGELALADADLRQAECLFVRLGEHATAAAVRQNLGFVAARRGDLPAALKWFDRADEFFHAHGLVDAVGLRDRCEALIPARLVAEARHAASSAVSQLTKEGRAAYLAEARLMLAEAALLDGDNEGAQAEAEEAALAFGRQRRRSWRALARLLSVRAAWLGGERSPSLLTAARRAAGDLDATGWAVQALDARLIAGHVALGLGRVAAARKELARATAARRRGPVELRVRAWHAQALLRLADGDRRGAERALRAGLGALDRYRGALGATELRVHASAHGGDLARMGLQLALDDGQPQRVLAWAERWRAGGLQLHPVRPPDDRQLSRGLDELRQVARDVDAAALAGQPTGPLLARQAALEGAVRHQARHTTTVGLSPSDPPPRSAALSAALGERALVEIIDCDGQLHAVVVAGGRARLRRLGPVDVVRSEVESLRFALRRLAFGRGSVASLATFAATAAHASRRLDELLLEPVRPDIGVRSLVVVPTAELHAMPWSSLPTCAERPVTVAPSAALWCRAVASPPAGTGAGARVVLAAGPGLAHAAAEVAALSRRYPGAARFTGRRATARAVATALDGADLAHVAAHGRFRIDNPLFSCLQLADGPLTVYDLEALEVAPRCLVLSACDSGLSGIRSGDEVMGLAGALFSLGTRTLVGTVIPVPDAATRDLMLSFHRHLREERSPADALSRVQAAASGDPSSMAAAAGFVCFGAGT
ncbi:MAG: CHAT domain-containing protein [Acidimicrobiales bacterium]